ncbi:MAG TPA: pyrroline-5-carboxylate reductase [Geminicoccaceae bacterium]|nr:pyrroline-5-carboxylate reductase [Geminicoccaceae bacterium]
MTAPAAASSAGLRGPLLLVGCGKMGGALLEGWLARGLPPAEATVVEPDAGVRERLRGRGVAALAGPEELPGGGPAPAALVLAVKPQTMDATVAAYREPARRGALVLSIAAGKTIAGFERAFGAEAAIVRAMPNTPAAIGRGMTVLSANPRVTPAQRDLATALMGAVGGVEWVEDEELLHAVTALSGGGPAYVFLLIEALARAGVASGLPAELSTRLARATVAGSGALADRSPEPAEVLRRNVTSPGGTTAEALRVLMAEDGLQPLFDRAIAAAAARSRELA